MRKLVNKFKGRLEVEVRRQEEIEERWKVKLNPEADEFKRSKLPKNIQQRYCLNRTTESLKMNI